MSRRERRAAERGTQLTAAGGGFLTVARFNVALVELNAAIVRKGLSDAAAFGRAETRLKAEIAALEARVAQLEGERTASTR